ncbi:TlpA family protein disulfide reductase [Nonomuraea sp. MTCD27]|uniref:TlpA family protein disulfide reductase n=1 Tax=Nonomuraea sp. MTCD27 TaxID=1676747 RepID=UPI0035C05A96
MSFELTALLVTWVAIALLSLVVAGLIRQVHALTTGPRTRETGTPVGSVAPEIDRIAPGRDGTVLLLFLTDSCPSCALILDEASRAVRENIVRPELLHAIFPGEARDGVTLPNVHAGESDLFPQYRITTAPFAVAVDADGHVRASEPVGSPAAFEAMLSKIAQPTLTRDRTI